jgi:uncharacterized protein YdgA (DUF945 family)
VKKGVVALLLVLAVVVLVSPGIIGRLAEQSVGDNLDWAAKESSEVSITSTGFERGWFTSAGQHRLELREGELFYLLPGASEDLSVDEVPALLIDTRLDHGLIPLASMNREHGSLMPGLGNAVSTLSLELADASIEPLPGTIYSSVGLGGELQSHFVLQADGRDVDGARIDWGSADFLLRSNSGSGGFSFSGVLKSLAIEAETETVIVGTTDIDLDLSDSGFGFLVGPAELKLESFAVISAAEAVTAGPFYLKSDSGIDDGRLAADVTLSIENVPLPLGAMSDEGGLHMVLRLENADAAALGRLKLSLDAMRSGDFDRMAGVDVEGDLKRLLARGLTIHFDQLDFASSFGEITSRLSASITAVDEDDFTWAAALMALDASADLSLPAALVNMAAHENPELHAAIGMGFLRKQGDFYITKAAFKQGLLNINGAPMPIPLTGWQ